MQRDCVCSLSSGYSRQPCCSGTWCRPLGLATSQQMLGGPGEDRTPRGEGRRGSGACCPQARQPPGGLSSLPALVTHGGLQSVRLQMRLAHISSQHPSKLSWGIILFSRCSRLTATLASWPAAVLLTPGFRSVPVRPPRRLRPSSLDGCAFTTQLGCGPSREPPLAPCLEHPLSTLTHTRARAREAPVGNYLQRGPMRAATWSKSPTVLSTPWENRIKMNSGGWCPSRRHQAGPSLSLLQEPQSSDACHSGS